MMYSNQSLGLCSSLKMTGNTVGIKDPVTVNNMKSIKALRLDKHPVSVSTPPVIVLRHLLPFPAMRLVRRNG
jgi:hypothetical protein